MTFTCQVTNDSTYGIRWKCTDTTGRSWLAGSAYRYNGKLASEGSDVNLDVFGIYKINPTVGKEWFSTTWNNGINRKISEGKFDQYDSKLKYLNGDPDTTKLEITGTGEARISEWNGSTRIFVYDSWLNTEMSVFLYLDNDKRFDDIQLRSRSRHQEACSFGGYTSLFRHTGDNTPEEKWTQIEVEPMHPHYKRHLARNTNFQIIRNKWIGFKSLTRSAKDNKSVKIESFVCYDILKKHDPKAWTKVTELTVTGSSLSPNSDWHEQDDIIACKGKGDGQADKMVAKDKTMFLYTQPGAHCWLRINGLSNGSIQYFSVREIASL